MARHAPSAIPLELRGDPLDHPLDRTEGGWHGHPDITLDQRSTPDTTDGARVSAKTNLDVRSACD